MVSEMLGKALIAIRAAMRKFRPAEDGNVAMMFGVAAIPLIVAVGGVVDYSRETMVHSDMQDSLDATALMLSKSASDMTPAQMTQAAQDYFNTDFTNADAENVSITPTYASSGPSVTVTGSATVKAYFLGLIGLPQVTISASSTVVWGQTRLRVSLVLDNTGSMASSGKIEALKTASHKLLDQLKAATSRDGDVYVSIIPFSKDVNVGPANYAQSWVRWDLWDEVNGGCSGRPARGQYSTKTDCESASFVWTVANHDGWNGCVTDRDQDYDTRNTAPSGGNTATLFPAEQYGNCPAGVQMGLTYDWTALGSAVDAMQPNGNTDQAVGLQWGWQSLTQAPFSIPAFDPTYQYKQIIILLSDGLNTQDRWYTNQGSIDARQQRACDNLKAGGIVLYAVQVNTGNDPTSTLLQNCATDANKFFLLTSADQIVTTFESIGTALSELRVSK
jgi:Flp pilus assembly protein TadG